MTNYTRTVISQRLRLADLSKLSQDEKLARILRMGNRELSEDQLDREISVVKELAAKSESYLIDRRNCTREQVTNEIADMNREQKERNLNWMLSFLKEKNSEHHGMELPDMFRFADTLQCENIISDMEEEDLNSTYLTCAELTARYKVAATVCQRENAEVLYEGLDLTKTERYQIVVAAAMNMKWTEKLGTGFADMDDQTLADMVCADLEINDICPDISKPNIKASHLVIEAVDFVVAAYFGAGAIAAFMLSSPVVGLLAVAVSMFFLCSGASLLCNDLFPAGFSETKVGQYLSERTHDLTQKVYSAFAKYSPAAQSVEVQTGEPEVEKEPEEETETSTTAYIEPAYC